MPLQRRLPKRGFKSTTLKYNAEITLTDLERMEVSEVDLLTLKQIGLVGEMSRFVKVIKTGVLTRAVYLKGISASAGARQSIESVGGSIV
jgi:large subunit ribosomal protein L15